jgi:hypothetical protein
MVTRTVIQQIRNNLVAIISLVVAVSSLSYNTWRNEVTEENRNIRFAGFEALKNLGELQTIVDFGHYDKNPETGSPIEGWGRVLLIRDLADIIKGTVPDRAKILFDTWQANWEGIGNDSSRVEHITVEIMETRQSVQNAINRLD